MKFFWARSSSSGEYTIERQNFDRFCHLIGFCRIGGAIESILEDYSGEELKVIGLNCEGMTFIDSIGVGGLIRVAQYSKENDILFIVYALSAVMNELFKKNDWERIFKPISKQEFEQTHLGE